ncbi:hypothetical protein [Rhodococcus opacus]|uniref:hypothetical protein n=1 Tax=Rhodococcus opacus TaxID=37919 RepID=UPI001C43BBC5|nr:hypothetical protein [Rhodococcus opacus]MBV6758343.1 hypothetical protein [Rhodococcus opacus]
MPMLTGTIRNAAGDLLTGLLEVKALSPRKSFDAAATIGPAYREIDVTNGVIDPTEIEPGPIKVSARFDGWMQDFHPNMPEDDVDFWDLIESTIPYTPEVQTAVHADRLAIEAAADRAEAVADAQDSAIADVVASGETKAVLDATYAPVYPATTAIAYSGGNVSSVTTDGVATTYTYNTDGTVATDTRAGVTRSYTYDGSGNLTLIEEI